MHICTECDTLNRRLNDIIVRADQEILSTDTISIRIEKKGTSYLNLYKDKKRLLPVRFVPMVHSEEK